MSAESAPERRRGDRRRADELRFWRALKGGERRVGERRRGILGTTASERLDGKGAPERAGRPRAVDDPSPTSTSTVSVLPAGIPAANTAAPEPPASDVTASRAEDGGDDADGASPRDVLDAADVPVADPLDTPPPAIAPGHPVIDLDRDPDAERRDALRQLLRAAEARRDRSNRARRPVLGRGARVRVLRGELAGQLATVADADYIRSRVLLDPDGDVPSRWVPFKRVGAV